MRKRGYTMTEVLVASLALGLVGVGTISLTGMTVRAYAHTMARSDVSLDVTQTLQWLARDLQQAKDANLIQTYHLQIVMPVRNADGSFQRSVSDNVNTIEYFRANAAGTPSATGTFVIRRVAGINPRRMCAGTTLLTFESDSLGSVNVSLSATGSYGATFRMIHRAIYMRNN